MATPLFKSMKPKGTSFYVFPSSAQDLNLANMNDNYKMTFSKYALLNIPQQDVVIEAGIQRDQEDGIMNFDKDSAGPVFFNYQPGANSDLPVLFSNQLIESLRNYVANYDTTLKESKINSNTDFYNVYETLAPTEMIFWKWARKLRLIDLEPAIHKIDWDKNLSDFDNVNGTDSSYFNKYLWKERDIINYDCTVTDGGGNIPKVVIEGIAKFKVGDKVIFSGDTSTVITGNVSGGTEYLITSLLFSGTTSNPTTEFFINSTTIDGSVYSEIIYLSYNKLIEVIGDIQSVSQVSTSKNNFMEVSIQIPHHAGSTPTILFSINDNTNYYPALEMPILPQEQQEEIVGAENTNSPIRLNPENYPGTHYGYFDTVDKSYQCPTGDKLRYSGNYYGINLTNNIGLDEETYIEKLNKFNSNNIDGVKLDFNIDHYLKMNLPEILIRNFDEFNSTYFDAAPSDYFFNAILWYYDLDDGSGNIVSNLFGIEFLNNPNDDDDDTDTEYKLITRYKKLVSNGDQDGYSYIFDFNLDISVDNDNLPLEYDPTTIYNKFGFDLYQNILQSNAKLQDNFLSIISGYTFIQEELFELRSLIMDDIDIRKINSQIENLNNLLQLYSSMQLVDSDTNFITVNYEDVYPTVQINTIVTEFENINNTNVSDVFEFNDTNSGSSYIIPVSRLNKTRLNIWNENNDFNGSSQIVISNDLSYKQALEIYIKPNLSANVTNLDININYDNGLGTISEENILSAVTMPIDLTAYDSINPTGSTFTNNYYNNSNLTIFSKNITTGTTTIFDLTENLFEIDDVIYIDNFYLVSGSSITDYSGVYTVSGSTTNSIEIDLDVSAMTLKSPVKISYYKGWKFKILRIDSTLTSTLTDRYEITKELL